MRPSRRGEPGAGEPGGGGERPREPSALEHLKWSFVMVLATLAVAAVSIALLRLAGCQNELSRG